MPAAFRAGELETAGSLCILFLLAWQLIAVQKACQSPSLLCPIRATDMVGIPDKLSVGQAFQPVSDAGRDSGASSAENPGEPF